MSLRNRILLFTGGIILLIIGWFVLTIFIQQSHLTITAEAPYTLHIDQNQTINCPQQICSTAINPGNHTVVVSKDGYRDITETLDIPAGQEIKRELNFEFIPLLTEEVDIAFPEENKPYNAWQEKTAADLQQKLPPQTPLFFEKNYIIYLQVNPITGLQSLYSQGIMGDPQLITSFPRYLKNYQIIPALEQHKGFIIIDQTYTRSSLYLIDTESKIRQLIGEYPYVSKAKWLSNGDILFEIHDETSIAPQLILYQVKTKALQSLDVTVNLRQLAEVDGRFIMATQTLVDGETPTSSQLGQLVTIEPPLVPDDTLPVSIIEYQNDPINYRLLAIAPFNTLVANMAVQEDQSILISTGGKVYRLVLKAE